MSVSGFVKDISSNKAIVGIEIIIFKLEHEKVIDVFTGTSDINGFYKIRYLNAGKYRFAIDIPEIGRVHIGMIASNGSMQGFYDLEIKEGRNTELNFYLEENSYPYIERNNISEYWINFTMQYVRHDLQISGISNSLSKSETLDTSCGDLTIKDAKKTEVPGKKEIITRDGKKAEGLFVIQFTYKGLIKCPDGKCVVFNLTGIWDTEILFHSMEWYKDKYPDRSEKLNLCNLQCTLEHEKIHSVEFKPIACNEFTKLVEYTKNISTPCCEENMSTICKDELRKLVDEMITRVDDTLKEDSAYEASDSCKEKCLEENKE